MSVLCVILADAYCQLAMCVCVCVRARVHTNAAGEGGGGLLFAAARVDRFTLRRPTYSSTFCVARFCAADEIYLRRALIQLV